MIYDLLQSCSHRFHSSCCRSCTYEEYCPNDCGKCLYYVHFPPEAPEPRKYDCTRMCDYYVCKYACKYASEMYYAFTHCRDLRDKQHLKVLSLGCGPCTDLLAIHQLREDGDYQCESVEYVGIELDTEIWSNVYADLTACASNDYSLVFEKADVCEYIDVLRRKEWRPNVIVLQYVFSDMQKHCRADAIDHFLSGLALYIESCSCNTYIICNDINLSNDRGGGRDYFDTLLRRLSCAKQSQKLHFNNSNRPNHFNYGEEYDDNSLVFVTPPEVAFFEPYTSCASAQLIIKKVN